MADVRLLTYRLESVLAVSRSRKRCGLPATWERRRSSCPRARRSTALTRSPIGPARPDSRHGGQRPTVGAAEALSEKSKRLGVGIDTGLWAQEGVAPADGLALIKERLRYSG